MVVMSELEKLRLHVQSLQLREVEVTNSDCISWNSF